MNISIDKTHVLNGLNVSVNRHPSSKPKNYSYILRTIYQCHLCYSSFNQQDLFYSHIKQSHRRPELSCCLDYSRSNAGKDLTFHIENVHTFSMVKYKCLHCDDQYTDKDDLEQHLNESHNYEIVLKRKSSPVLAAEATSDAIVTNGNKVQAKKSTVIPKAKVNNNVEVKSETVASITEEIAVEINHDFISARKPNDLVDVQASRPYKCQYCGRAFGRNDHLKRHMLSQHIHKKVYICKVCGEQFKRHDVFISHSRKQHNMTQFDVDESGMEVPEFADVGQPLYSDNEYPEELSLSESLLYYGAQLFDRISDRENGIASQSEEIKSNSSLSSSHNERSQTPAPSPGAHDLLVERKSEFVELSQVDTVPAAKNPEDSSRYQCKWCVLSYRRKHHLARHIKNTHILGLKRRKLDLNSGRPLQGNLPIQTNGIVPPNQFSKLPSQRNTENTNSKRFKCKACSSTYGRKDHLVRHINAKHFNIRNFECRVCKSQFQRKEHFKRHMKFRHNFDITRQYVCSHCPALFFSSKTDLNCHNLEDHQIGPLDSIE